MFWCKIKLKAMNFIEHITINCDIKESNFNDNKFKIKKCSLIENELLKWNGWLK